MLDNLLIVWKTCAWITIFSNCPDTKPYLHFEECHLIFFKSLFLKYAILGRRFNRLCMLIGSFT